MIHLYCATGNPGKLREFRMAAQTAEGSEPRPLGSGPDRFVQIDLLPGFHKIPPCIEDGSTFEENAILKGRYYGKHTAGLLFAEDSGLEVDALGGAPGIYSARFSGPQATDEANNRLLLARLEGTDARSARYVCVIALVDSGRLLETFRGTVEGEIVREPRGSNGFGYDPLFYYPLFGRTFGETAPERKWEVSHRGKAFRATLDWLTANRKYRTRGRAEIRES